MIQDNKKEPLTDSKMTFLVTPPGIEPELPG